MLQAANRSEARTAGSNPVSMGKLVNSLFANNTSAGFQKYFSNTFWLLFERIFSMGMSFFIGAWVARYLGPEGQGILSYGQSFIMFFMIFADLGLNKILVRELVESSDRDPHKTLGTSLVLRLFSAGLAFLGLIIFLQIWSQGETTDQVIMVLGLTVLVKAVSVIFESHLNARVLGKLDARVKLISGVISNGFRVLAIVAGMELVWFAYILLTMEVINAIGLGWFNFKSIPNIGRWRFDWGYLRHLLRDSWSLLLSGFVITVYMQVDQVMITKMLGAYQNGIYAVAMRLLSVWYFIPGIVAKAILPAIMNAYKQDYKLFNERVQVLMDLFFIIGGAIGLGMALFGDWLINTLFGIEYAAATQVIYIHIWSLIFVFIGTAGSNWLLCKNLQHISLYRTILGMVVNVSLNYFLIPLWGIEGAAVATLISQAMASYFGYLLSPKTHEVFYMQTRSLFGISLVQTLRSGKLTDLLKNRSK